MSGISRPRAYRNWKQRLRAPLDELWDRRLGVRTFGFHPESGAFGEPEWGCCFVPLQYSDIFAALDAARIAPDDVFVDLGSGTGRAVFAAAWRGARRAIGVEYVPWLAEAAEENRRNSRLRDRDIAFIAADARAVPLAEATILYLFHPFGRDVLSGVLERLRADRAAAGSQRRLRICYVNPVFEDVLDGCDWLRPGASLPVRRPMLSFTTHYRTRIWETV